MVSYYSMGTLSIMLPKFLNSIFNRVILLIKAVYPIFKFICKPT